MPKHDEARRAFLVGAAVGAGAVASAGLLPQAHGQSQGQHTTAAGSAATHAHSGAPGHGAFLNDEDAATVRAFADRLMPGAPGNPGQTHKEPFRRLPAARVIASTAPWS